MIDFLCDSILVAAVVLEIWYINGTLSDHINAIEKIARELTTLREFLQNKFDSDTKTK